MSRGAGTGFRVTGSNGVLSLCKMTHISLALQMLQLFKSEVSTKCVHVPYVLVSYVPLLIIRLFLLIYSAGLLPPAWPQRVAEIHPPPPSTWGTHSRA